MPVSWQSLSGTHTLGGPLAHDPDAHVSFAEHGSPSSQGAVLNAVTHPMALSHVSSVHTSPSLHIGGGPPTHAPALHESAVVHAFASSHAFELFVYWHPPPGKHTSSVQTLLSLQSFGGPPMHTPAKHVSAAVHTLPSSHGPPSMTSVFSTAVLLIALISSVLLVIVAECIIVPGSMHVVVCAFTTNVAEPLVGKHVVVQLMSLPVAVQVHSGGDEMLTNVVVGGRVIDQAASNAVRGP